jgi:hypothetical protein
VAGEGAIMPLIAALYETGVRSAPVIEALAQFDDERVLDPVLTQLTSSDITTCLAAITLIRTRRPVRAIRPLVLAIGAGGKGPGNRSSTAVDTALVEALVDYGRDALPILAERQQTDTGAIIDVVIERIMKQGDG